MLVRGRLSHVNRNGRIPARLEFLCVCVSGGAVKPYTSSSTIIPQSSLPFFCWVIIFQAVNIREHRPKICKMQQHTIKKYSLMQELELMKFLQKMKKTMEQQFTGQPYMFSRVSNPKIVKILANNKITFIKSDLPTAFYCPKTLFIISIPQFSLIYT